MHSMAYYGIKAASMCWIGSIQVQGVRESVSTGFQKAWHITARIRGCLFWAWGELYITFIICKSRILPRVATMGSLSQCLVGLLTWIRPNDHDPTCCGL